MSTQNDNPGDDAPQINAAPQTDDTPQTSALVRPAILNFGRMPYEILAEILDHVHSIRDI
ncbi:hypothetical protein PG995_010554 [Apiospora arundinis]